MAISEFSIGEAISETLLVKTADIALTKGKKPYLRIELTDGVSTIGGVDWDWGDNPAPAKNAIANVVAQVSEYNGNKQLNIKRLLISESTDVSRFVPKGPFDIEEYVLKSKDLINTITNEKLKAIVYSCFKDNIELWRSIPSANGIHHAFVAGNLKHSVDVAIKAQAIANTMQLVDVDLCVAGGLLQDLGKLWTYEFNGAVIEMTEHGKFIEHIMIGAIRLEKYRTEDNGNIINLLQHIVSSHHSKLEYGSPTTPICLEAWIVAAADQLDAKTQMIYEQVAKANPDDKMTGKVFQLENRAQLLPSYVTELMKG